MMQRAADGTNEDTHTLSDVKGSVYKKFQVKPRVKGFIYAMTVMPKILKKFKDIKGKGRDEALLQLPADFLIDENGIIVDVHRSKKTQDYIGFERIEAFIPKEKRCSCNKKDCISPACRETYAQIRKDAEAMLYLG